MAFDKTTNISHALKRWGRRAALGVLLGSAASAALAGNPKIDIAVTAAPASVTFSRPAASPPFVSRAAYEVRITNSGKNTVNSVEFTATSLVQAGAAGAVAPFVEATGATCVATDTAKLAISCDIGKMKSGTSVAFTVVFEAPASGSNIKLGWITYYGEGKRDSKYAAHCDTQTGSVLTALTAPSPNAASSYLATNTTLFTGETGIPTKTDQWVTLVKTPRATTAQVVEDINPESCSSVYNLCVRSTLTLPGQFDYLTITLRRDASTIRSCSQIINAILRYEPGAYNTAGVFVPSGPPVDIPSCDLLPNRMPNASYPRCIDSRIAYTKKNTAVSGLWGDWEFVIKALENGRISW